MVPPGNARSEGRHSRVPDGIRGQHSYCRSGLPSAFRSHFFGGALSCFVRVQVSVAVSLLSLCPNWLLGCANGKSK